MTASALSVEDNQVFLRGVLAAEPEVRVLPSGDEITVFRVTVTRPAGSRAKVDSIDCQTDLASVTKALGRVAPGATLEITGALRRRFWRGAGGLASRYEVEVRRVKPVRAGRRNAS